MLIDTAALHIIFANTKLCGGSQDASKTLCLPSRIDKIHFSVFHVLRHSTEQGYLSTPFSVNAEIPVGTGGHLQHELKRIPERLCNCVLIATSVPTSTHNQVSQGFYGTNKGCF